MALADTARVQTRNLGDKILVMDRWSGNWAMLDSDAEAIVDSALESWSGSEDRDGALALRGDASAELRGALRTAGIGTAIPPLPTQLNTVILKLTKACNYVCTYCYDLEHGEAIGNMSLDTARATIEEAMRLAHRATPDALDLIVILHGGEPMLRFSLIKEIVIETEALAEKLGKTVMFCGQTNMSRITDEIVTFSREHRIQWGVSLDGPPRLNDRFRVLKNGDGTYAAYERARERFPDFVRSCPVLSVITNNNQANLLEIARHFRTLGAPGWDWTLFQPIGMGRAQAATFAFSTEVVIASWNELFDAVEAGEFDGFHLGLIMDYLRGFITSSNRSQCMRNGCGAARDVVSVEHDGTIQACDCIDRTGPLANLGVIQVQTRDSIERARSSDKAALIRSRNVELGECGKCLWLAVCGGSCLAYVGSLHGIHGTQCAIAMNAFDRISHSIASNDGLRRYWQSLAPSSPEPQIPISVHKLTA